ncbi:MAG TPA: NfeD family protein [Acidimicrobiales bacterium]|nr:NfeD family protein [Acidimicrobiales bacterium]
MWAIAGVLLGLVAVASLVGFHAGPHSHAFAGGVGLVAAVWLVVMALTGQSGPLLWLFFGADVAVSAAVGTAAWKGLQAAHQVPAVQPTRLEGAHGHALVDLNPEGTVRVRGETWSARSLNGRIAAGSEVQVINAKGVRLEVWGEGNVGHPPFALGDAGLDDSSDNGRTASS